MLSNCHRISWGSIIAGIFTVIAISILLSTLGTSLGFTMLDPYSDQPVAGIGTTFLIWTVVSSLISLALGGYVAGRLAGNTGVIHGFLVWATTLVISLIFSSMLVIGVAKMAGSAIGAIGSATGSMASGAQSVVSHGASSLESLFSNLDIDTDVDKTEVQQNIKSILKKTNIDTLQPDYLQKQLTKSAHDVKWAVKQIVLNPNNTDDAIDKLTNQLKTRADNITADIDRNSVVTAIQKNSDLNQQQAEQVIDNYLEARENIQQTVEQRLDDARDALQKAKGKYQELKQEAKDKADKAASEMATIACWSFVALLIGAILSAIAGCCGVRHSLRKNC